MCRGHSLFFKKISSIQGESAIGLQTWKQTLSKGDFAILLSKILKTGQTGELVI